MFYEPGLRNHGLARDPFKALVVPRPIGWISSLSADGAVNLAPYSYFNAIESDPPIVVIGSGGMKDTASNIDATREFVCSLATYDLSEAMNATSAPLPAGVSEFEHAGLAPAPSRLVRPPRVAASPVALECVALSVSQLHDRHGRAIETRLIVGEVIGIHIDESLLVDGRVDITRARPIARLGYMDYAVIDQVFSINRPKGG